MVERRRPPGEKEHVIFYCDNCGALVEDIDFDCADIVQHFSQAMLDFWNDDARRTCKKCGTKVPKPEPVKASEGVSVSGRCFAYGRLTSDFRNNLLMKIDLHTHILPRDWPDLDAKYGYSGFVRLDHYQPCCARMMIGDRVFREITDNVWDPKRRIEECDRAGVSMQVLSTVPVMFSYWAKPADALDLSRRLNDHIAGSFAIIRNDSPVWEPSRCKIRIWPRANWNDAFANYVCAACRSAPTWMPILTPVESTR